MPGIPRRSFLTSLWAGLGITVAGCLGSPPTGSIPREGEGGTDGSTPTYTRTGPTTKPVRCRGEPVSVERSLSDSPGYADDIEYFPDNRTVRFVSVRSGDEPVGFGSWSFEKWGSITCTEIALERVRRATADRLGTDEFGSSYGSPPDFHQSDGFVVRVEVGTYVEDGEPVHTPTVPFPRLVNVAPRSADVTLSLEGDRFSRSVPVFAEHVELGMGGGGGGGG